MCQPTMLGQACLIPMTPHNGGGFASIQIWTGGGKSGGGHQHPFALGGCSGHACWDHFLTARSGLRPAARPGRWIAPGRMAPILTHCLGIAITPPQSAGVQPG